MSIGVLVLEIREWARFGAYDFPAEWKEIEEKSAVLARSGGDCR
jgi:hypothetical protein